MVVCCSNQGRHKKTCQSGMKMGFVRFTQVRLKYVEETKAKIREKVLPPDVTIPQLRRARMPFIEVIKIELCEGKFYKSWDWIKDELLAALAANIDLRRLNHAALEELHEGFQKAETIHGFDVVSLLDMAQKLENLRFEWVAEKIFLFALSLADTEYLKALSHYLYATFLFNVRKHIHSFFAPFQKKYELAKLDEAMEHLQCARKFDPQLDVIDMWIRILLEKSLKLTDPVFGEEAIELCKRDPPNILRLINAYYVLASVVRSTSEPEKSIELIRHGREHAIEIRNENLMCQAHHELALTYYKIKDLTRFESHVRHLKRLASKYNQKEYLADALLWLAPIYVKAQKYDELIVDLSKVKEVSTNREKVVRAGHFLAIAKSVEMLPTYLDEVLKAEETNQHLFNILNWKICRNFSHVTVDPEAEEKSNGDDLLSE